jgi:alpha-amylase/alpha-mannosidase (GH57 family)
MTNGIDLALILHLHQPVYLDPESPDPTEAILPWVRLHAARAYYDLARVLWEHPGARMHLNVTPCLVDQLDGFARGELSDRFQTLTLRHAVDLTEPERELVWASFFMVDWDAELRLLPRYRELLAQRGEDLAHVDLPRIARESTHEQLRDLQVLFNLAWTGFSLREEEPSLQELLAKGRGYSEPDKALVLQCHARAAQRVIPLWRALESRGQVEMSATPHYHPILPLLIDSDSARSGLPGVALPKRFAYPEDARRQVREARRSHTERFGRPPRGMWPAEGSVSAEAAEIFHAEGASWIASDEGVLYRSLSDGGITPERDALYEGYELQTPTGVLDVVFRDHALSDLIGFQYARTEAEAAVADLFSHLSSIGQAWGGGGRRPLVTLVLDGENPWEHYPHAGQKFLHRLCKGLEENGTARPVLLGEALPQRRKRRLSRLHPGSWIDSNFRVWIGHPEHHQAAWDALSTVRHALAQARAAGFSPALCEEAERHLLVAEGSDWFWWYSGEFATETAAEFDQLFRARLRAASAALGIDPPAQSERSLQALAARRAPVIASVHLPEALLAPTLDGRVTHFGEWSKAGRLLADPARGAMFQGSLVFLSMHFGFDPENLFLRLDPKDRSALSGDGDIVVEVHLSSDSKASTLSLSVRQDVVVPVRSATGSDLLGESCAHSILEARISLSKLGLRAGDRMGLWLAIKRKGMVLQRLPAAGALDVVVPGTDFERAHWKV